MKPNKWRYKTTIVEQQGWNGLGQFTVEGLEGVKQILTRAHVQRRKNASTYGTETK